MLKASQDDQDALQFASVLSKANLHGSISIGKFSLPCKRGVSDSIQYNQAGLDMLNNQHEYTFDIQDGELQVSLQLYENIAGHHRLFCYTRIGNKQGMAFSVNLTTEKEGDNVIYLTQKIKFVEQYKGSTNLAQAHRRQKQVVFCDLLKKLGLDVTESGDLLLGVFDPLKGRLINTSADSFLNDFIVVSILKGHFQGNKGCQLEILPTYNKLDYIFTGKDEELDLPAKLVDNKVKRVIPLGMRYKVLKRDSFKCVACGRTANDGIKLHIDHKVPFSLGGLTELSNLQTLCNECNISKSNKFLD
ncbi:MAG TPA: HNH endonuclease signature motif containing protein [Hymenobacter sp.]|uniref:HNH endonuclease n=1 Tax=Hymenobacter sp. TaxID=1898978 RepID=UPI002D7F7586|nr:HNH endonuclease signature motif containing protein [Hymenobacter sp.]HET9502655.1 HNH endonuclease signature motif containing protein [Hymenobacter sp.]